MLDLLTTAAVLAADPSQPELTGITKWVVDIMTALGPVGVALAIFLENVWPPIPSEVILPLAGFTASQGGMPLWAAILAATIGSITGAWMLYGLGAAVGHDRMVRFFEWMPLTRGEDIDKTGAWFKRHGNKAVFFGRFVPVFRSLISIPAGIERMPLVSFSLFTTAGSLIWNSIFVLLGFWLGEQWHLVEPYTDWMTPVVVVIVGALILWWVARRIRDNRRRARDGANTHAASRDTPGSAAE